MYWDLFDHSISLINDTEELVFLNSDKQPMCISEMYKGDFWKVVLLFY